MSVQNRTVRTTPVSTRRGVDEQSTDPDQLAGLQDACHCVRQQRAPDVLALMASIDGKAREQDDRYWLIGRQTLPIAAENAG
jgi:hypothetical protein